jgi:hypothetical protein
MGDIATADDLSIEAFQKNEILLERLSPFPKTLFAGYAYRSIRHSGVVLLLVAFSPSRYEVCLLSK